MSGLSPDDTDDVLELAEFLHDEYERAATVEGWDTQDGTSVPFRDLPPDNQRTMLRVALSLLQWYDVNRSEFHVWIEDLIAD